MAAAPLFCIVAVLSTDWSADTRVDFAAFAVLWLVFILLGCSLFFFMFPRFLVPPPIRHRQSLASRTFRGHRNL